MSTVLNVIELPSRDLSDVPRTLRELAERIESGDLAGKVHNVAWAADAGGGDIRVGLCGAAPEPGATAHFLLALGMRRLEAGVLP
jgi:hypothetical protein